MCFLLEKKTFFPCKSYIFRKKIMYLARKGRRRKRMRGKRKIRRGRKEKKRRNK